MGHKVLFACRQSLVGTVLQPDARHDNRERGPLQEAGMDPAEHILCQLICAISCLQTMPLW